MGKKEKTCETCMFSHPSYGDTRYECRRYAPHPVMLQEGAAAWAIWPRVAQSYWCGEWSPVMASWSLPETEEITDDD